MVKKNNRFFEESNFYDWLIDNNITSKASAISYCSYVNSVNNNNDLYFNNKLLEIHKNEISQNYSELIEEVLQILTAKDFYKKINKADKTISNWKSGFRAYGEFLVNNFQFEDEGTIAYEIDDESLLMDYKISYTKQDLFKNFTLRLITQDRLSGEVYFPISFIKKIFYKTNNKAFFDVWIKNILNNTEVHLENSEIKLNEISNLYIDSEGVKIDLKNKYLHVYTKHENNIDKSPFKTKELKKISLDHIIPMKLIMDKLGSQLFEFQKITYEINIKLKKEKLNRPKLAKISNELISEMFLDKVNLNQLKNDMDLIRKNTNLQLMDSKINSKKRAN